MNSSMGTFTDGENIFDTIRLIKKFPNQTHEVNDSELNVRWFI